MLTSSPNDRSRSQDYLALQQESLRLSSESLEPLKDLLNPQDTWSGSPGAEGEPPSLTRIRQKAERAESKKVELEQRLEQSRQRMQRFQQTEDDLTRKIETSSRLGKCGAVAAFAGICSTVAVTTLGPAAVVVGVGLLAAGLGGLVVSMRAEKLALERENNRMALIEGHTVDSELARLCERQSGAAIQARALYEEACLPLDALSLEASPRVREGEGQVVIGSVVLPRR